jgi:hypothetical protein
MDFLRVTRGKKRYEISKGTIKGISITKAKKLFKNFPEDIVEAIHIEVNGKPKKKSKE